MVGEAEPGLAEPGLPAEDWEIALAALSGAPFNRRGCFVTGGTWATTEHRWEGPVRRLGTTFYRRCSLCSGTYWKRYLG